MAKTHRRKTTATKPKAKPAPQPDPVNPLKKMEQEINRAVERAMAAGVSELDTYDALTDISSIWEGRYNELQNENEGDDDDLHDSGPDDDDEDEEDYDDDLD